MRTVCKTMSWLACALIAALLAARTDANELERLPDLQQMDVAGSEVTSLQPMLPLTNEAGFFARWRAGHQERAARDGWIETDRPSFTLSSSTVPKGWLQVETGYTYAYNDDIYQGRGVGYERIDSHTAPETTVRYGIGERLELRASWIGVTAEYLDQWEWNTAVSNLDVGIKWQATEQRRFVPKSALVCSLLCPTGDDGDLSRLITQSIQRSPFADNVDHVRPVLNYIYSWSLSERSTIGGSTGGVFKVVGESDSPHFFQSFVYRYYCSPRFDMFTEFYFFSQEFYQENYSAGFVDWGLRWRPLANVQLDWRIGADMRGTYQADGMFTGVGFSMRY